MTRFRGIVDTTVVVGGTPIDDVRTFKDERGSSIAFFSITTPFGDTTFRFIQRDGYRPLFPGFEFRVEVTNQADSLIYATEKSLAEYGDKVPEEDKTAIENDVAALKTAMEGDDIEDITSKIEALSQSSMKLGEVMYKAQQEAEAGEAPAEDGTGESAASDDDGSGEESATEPPDLGDYRGIPTEVGWLNRASRSP